MKKDILILLALALISSSLSAQGILDRLEKKAKDKVNQRIEKKVDEKMDKELDKVFESDQQSNSDSLSDSARSANFAKLLLGKKFSACTPKSQYTYSSMAVLDVYSKGKGKNDSFSMRYLWYINPNYDNMAMEIIPFSEKMKTAKGTKTIIDMKDSCIVTLMNQNGNKMMMTLKYGETDYSAYIDTTKSQTPVKTGKTKKINGKLCYEYVLDNEDTYQQMWLESSKTALWDQNLKNWKATSDPFKNSADFGQFFDFFPLETTTKDKKSKMVTTMYLRSVVKKQTTVKTAGYTQF